MTTARLGRPCSTCSHADRAEIENALLSAGSLSSLSSRWGLSVAGVKRHIAGHMAPELREQLRGSQAMNVTDLLQRLADIANDARDARTRALDAGNVSISLKAGDAELRALATITGRLGVDDSAVLAQLRDGEMLARAVGSLIRSHPQAVEALVAALEQGGASEMAGALTAVLRNERKAIQ